MTSSKSPNLWYRTYVRSSVKQDVDTLAGPAYLKEHFTDPFGLFLQEEGNDEILTADKLMRTLTDALVNEDGSPMVGAKKYKMTCKTYAVADAAFHNYQSYMVRQPETFPKWFQAPFRMISVVTPLNTTNNPPTPYAPFESDTFFVVYGRKIKKVNTFLQVASWDKEAQEFKFYGKEPPQPNGEKPSEDTKRAWLYQGKSSDAFQLDTDYLGPFNGHVNGALIMKELRKPWYHWFSNDNLNITKCLNAEDAQSLINVPYIGPSGYFHPDSAENLEEIIENSVTNWFKRRLQNDFFEYNESEKRQVRRQSPLNVKRWMAHLLLTTTVNIGAGQSENGNVNCWKPPLDGFIDMEKASLLSTDFSFFENLGDVSCDSADYVEAATRLDLTLLQQVELDDNNNPTDTPGFQQYKLYEGVLGGGKDRDNYLNVHFVKVPPNVSPNSYTKFEGVPFVTIQASLEDAQGAQLLYKNKEARLVSETCMKAILMLDPWNPVYSWRRGVLLQYVPETCVYRLNTKDYDLEEKFIKAVRNSKHINDEDSPEATFIELYDGIKAGNDGFHDDEFKKQLTQYLDKVNDNLSSPDGVEKYLALAEDRRRIYRPLPLDEFGFTLPYALKIQGVKFLEMKSDGETVQMPRRGRDFLESWIGSLSDFDPHLIPVQEAEALVANCNAESIPSATPNGAKETFSKKVAALHSHISCSAASKSTRKPILRKLEGRSSGCPFSSRLQQLRVSPAQNQKIIPADRGQQSLPVPEPPTWEDQIQYQFKSPYWIDDEERRKKVGDSWRKAMVEWSAGSLDLHNYDSVKAQAKTIYDHLRSRSMPLTKDSSYFFPDEALEAFRLWTNAGFPHNVGDRTEAKELIPEPGRNPIRQFCVRKDLLDLTPEEIQQFRAALDDNLKAGELNSKWQELGRLHADWCLHYQEATFFWHRAYLLYVEELIGMPIPYWNGFAKETSEIAPQFADFVGIPRIFLDETYTHPSGEVRKNPLKYALARDGRSKNPEDGQYVSRDEVLTNAELRGSDKWDRKIGLFEKYQQQIVNALSKEEFSLPMGFQQPFALPWANLPAFSDDQEDDKYPDIVKQTFDGLFEQPHDNYHGWVGPDMADNSYTALDPLFLVMHCNLDRILASYLQTHPAVTLTSNFPLRPFVDNGKTLGYDENREYLFVSIGEMARNTKALGYMYGPPKLTDRVPLLLTLGPNNTQGSCSQNGACSTTESLQAKSLGIDSPAVTSAATPRVIFPNLKCTTESYRICVFAENADSFEADITNPGFIGELARLGMGPSGGYKNPERCARNADGIIRELVVPEKAIKLLQDCEARLKVVVTEIGTGREVAEEEQEKIGGFKGYPVCLPRKKT